MELLCHPLQRDSGSLRLPPPGEVGLEISYQPQRTWFPNHPKVGFCSIFFFSLLFLSFFFFLPKPSPPLVPAGRFSSSTLHIPIPAPTAPGRAHRRRHGGTRRDNPSQPSTGGAGGDCGGSLGWRLGYGRVGQPGHTSHPQIPKSHLTEPVPIPKPVPSPGWGGRSLPGSWVGEAAELSQGMLTGIPGTVGRYRRDPQQTAAAAAGEGPRLRCFPASLVSNGS